jgi:hypothetical protein
MHLYTRSGLAVVMLVLLSGSNGIGWQQSGEDRAVLWHFGTGG